MAALYTWSGHWLGGESLWLGRINSNIEDRNDWVIQINEDLEMCNIIHSEEEIRNMNKYSFGKLVNKKVKEAATKYLMDLKKNIQNMMKLNHLQKWRNTGRVKKSPLKKSYAFFNQDKDDWCEVKLQK